MGYGSFFASSFGKPPLHYGRLKVVENPSGIAAQGRPGSSNKLIKFPGQHSPKVTHPHLLGVLVERFGACTRPEQLLNNPFP